MANVLRAVLAGVAIVASTGAAPSAFAQSQQLPPKAAPPAQQQQQPPPQQSQQPSSTGLRERVADAIRQVQSACGDELRNFCSTVTPGDGRLLLCMQAHQDKLSSRCELTLFQTSRNVAQAMHRIERIAEACWNDIQARCIGNGSIAKCMIDNRASLSPACQSVVAAIQQESPEQQPRLADFTGKPVFSSDGIKLGQVTNVQFAPDGSLQMIQAELGGWLGLGATQVLISPDEFEQRSDRLELKMAADQVWSAISGQKQ